MANHPQHDQHCRGWMHHSGSKQLLQCVRCCESLAMHGASVQTPPPPTPSPLPIEPPHTRPCCVRAVGPPEYTHPGIPCSRTPASHHLPILPPTCGQHQPAQGVGPTGSKGVALGVLHLHLVGGGKEGAGGGQGIFNIKEGESLKREHFRGV